MEKSKFKRKRKRKVEEYLEPTLVLRRLTDAEINNWRYCYDDEEKKAEREPPAKKRREFTASYLTNHWYVRDCWHYQVKWRGFPMSEATYEPHSNLPSIKLFSSYYEKWYGRPEEDEVQEAEAQLRNCVDKSVVESRESFLEFLDKTDHTFRRFHPDELDCFEKEVQRDLNRVARCLVLMEKPDAPKDMELQGRGVDLATLSFAIQHRREQLASLAQTQVELMEKETTPLYLENEADFDVFPTNFTYTEKMVLTADVPISEDPPLFCTCAPCDSFSTCCGPLNETIMGYNSKGLLRTTDPFPIYECNRRCACGPGCRNRVVQNGRKCPLTIFKTERYGWGVKARTLIRRGTFLCEFLGELLTEGESVVRDTEYVKVPGDYVFDLNHCDNTVQYCVDATKYGNVSRFINHGCSPNVQTHPTYVNCLDPSIHRLALFALRDIKAGEELSIDYMGGSSQQGDLPNMISNTPCRCGAANCRNWLFTKR